MIIPLFKLFDYIYKYHDIKFPAFFSLSLIHSLKLSRNTVP